MSFADPWGTRTYLEGGGLAGGLHLEGADDDDGAALDGFDLEFDLALNLGITAYLGVLDEGLAGLAVGM